MKSQYLSNQCSPISEKALVPEGCRASPARPSVRTTCRWTAPWSV